MQGSSEANAIAADLSSLERQPSQTSSVSETSSNGSVHGQQDTLGGADSRLKRVGRDDQGLLHQEEDSPALSGTLVTEVADGLELSSARRLSKTVSNPLFQSSSLPGSGALANQPASQSEKVQTTSLHLVEVRLQQDNADSVTSADETEQAAGGEAANLNVGEQPEALLKAGSKPEHLSASGQQASEGSYEHRQEEYVSPQEYVVVPSVTKVADAELGVEVGDESVVQPPTWPSTDPVRGKLQAGNDHSWWSGGNQEEEEDEGFVTVSASEVEEQKGMSREEVKPGDSAIGKAAPLDGQPAAQPVVTMKDIPARQSEVQVLRGSETCSLSNAGSEQPRPWARHPRFSYNKQADPSAPKEAPAVASSKSAQASQVRTGGSVSIKAHEFSYACLTYGVGSVQLASPDQRVQEDIVLPFTGPSLTVPSSPAQPKLTTVPSLRVKTSTAELVASGSAQHDSSAGSPLTPKPSTGRGDSVACSASTKRDKLWVPGDSPVWMASSEKPAAKPAGHSSPTAYSGHPMSQALSRTSFPKAPSIITASRL